MIPSQLNALQQLDLSLDQQARLGLKAARLTLRRAWPRGNDHLLLEYEFGTGHVVPGQWFADADRFVTVTCDTLQAALTAAKRSDWLGDGTLPNCGVYPLTDNAGYVLLQVGGADRTLRGLVPLLAQRNAHMLVHQPERRAVVRLGKGDSLCFAKTVPPKRLVAVVGAGQAVAKLAGDAFATPQPVEIDRAAGVVVWSALRGRSLYELWTDKRMVRWVTAAGAALKSLHMMSHITEKQYTAAHEVTTLQTWMERARAFVPALDARLTAIVPNVLAALMADSSRSALLHRDFYDKQVFVDDHGSVGLLDFDTLAIGEPALDLGNAMVHFELRAMQRCCTFEQAEAAKSALLDGYQPEAQTMRRLQAYMNAARLRLVCVYAFRPHTHHVIEGLCTRLGVSGKEREYAVM